MPKHTVQIRVDSGVAHDLGIIAAAFGKSVTAYVDEILREMTRKDLPRAIKLAKERAEGAKPSKSE